MKPQALEFGEPQECKGRWYRISQKPFTLTVPDVKLRRLAKDCKLRRCHRGIRTKTAPRTPYEGKGQFYLLRLENVKPLWVRHIRKLLEELGYRPASIWEVFTFIGRLSRLQRRLVLERDLVALGSVIARKREKRIPFINGKLHACLTDGVGDVFSARDIFLVCRPE